MAQLGYTNHLLFFPRFILWPAALLFDEPPPLFIYKGYGDSALELQFSVWAKRENFLLLRNTMQAEIKKVFDENDIEIPFPHRTLYTGSVTEPFPVRMVDDGVGGG